MNLSLIIRAALVPFLAALAGVLLILFAPSMGGAEAVAETTPDTCKASASLPFEAVMGPGVAVVTATLHDPTHCARSVHYNLTDAERHTVVGAPVTFAPGRHSVTITLREPGTFQLVADALYNDEHNASVTGLSASFRDSNYLRARLASATTLKVSHRQHATYVRPFAAYWEPQEGGWSELIDLSLRVQRSVEGHWVTVARTVSGERVRVHGAGPWRVSTPATPYIWGGVSDTRN